MGRLVSVVALAGVLAGCNSSSFRAMETVKLSADAHGLAGLNLANSVGDVRIIGDPSATMVRATATKIGKGTSLSEAQKALKEISVSMDGTDDRANELCVRTDHPRQNPTRQWEVKWSLVVPPNVELQVRTGVGDLRVQDMQGAVCLGSGVGDIFATRVSGRIEASSEVGDIDIGTAPGGATLRAGVGDIRARQVAGPVEADTGTGDILILDASPDGVSLRAGVGDIHLQMNKASEKEITASTNVGSMHVCLPREQTGSIHADADIGDVRVDLKGVPVTGLHHSRHALHGHLHGEDQPRIELVTAIGDLGVTVR